MNNNLDPQYKALLQDILDNGVRKEGRNGATYSVFGRTIRHNMQEGFPLLTTKKMYFKGIVTELQWFLRGRSDLRYLLEQGNKIWVGDAYRNYIHTITKNYKDREEIERDFLLSILSEEEFIDKIINDDTFNKMWGDLGRIYGKQWREWNDTFIDGEDSYGTNYIDQIQNLIDDLKNKPDSRRMMVTAWNPAELEDMVLPPCHYGFQVWTRELALEERVDIAQKKKPRLSQEALEKWVDLEDDSILLKELKEKRIPKRGISLLWNQRSVDTPLGLPFNIASYGLLLLMIADEVGMIPLELIGNLNDTHIYENQLGGVEEQLTRPSHPLPRLKGVTSGIETVYEDLELVNYTHEDKIEFPLSN